MPKQSAGLLMFRQNAEIEVLLVHPGGPFFAKKDLGAWSIPKGEYGAPESALTAAQREFREETGFPAQPPFLPLGEIRQGSGKLVQAWAFRGECDPATLVSNTCQIEWPPRSGQRLEIPEVDQARWFSLQDAAAHILPAQRAFLDRLVVQLGDLEVQVTTRQSP